MGTFHLGDLPPAPRGTPKIEVTFDIDANGIVNVAAKETTTGKETKITITGSGALNKDEVERMVQESEKNAAADQERREAAETKNGLDSLVFQVKKFRDENSDKIGESEKAALESALTEAETALQGEDVSTMKSATDALQQTYQAAGTSVYQNAAQTAEASGAQPSGSDYAGYDDADSAKTNGSSTRDAVEGEVVEGEVTDTK